MLARAETGSNEQRSLAALLRCPTCSSVVSVGKSEVTCRDAGHRFPVVDGVPVLVDEDVLAADPQYDHQRRYFDSELAGNARFSLEPWRQSYLRRVRAAGALAGPLVDVGVGGSGYTVIEAARAGERAIGCDLSLEGLLRARSFAAAEGVADRTFWVCCNVEKLPFADGSFGSALAIAVIEHVPDDVAALAEMARVLRPGGRAWVTVPHALGNVTPILRPANRRHDRRLGHLRRYEAEGLAATAAGVGLTAREPSFTGHPIKAVQLAASKVMRGGLGERFWWWCEARDLRRSHERRGSMQLSLVFDRA
jgi:SAM-dependent methyltransferase